MSPVTEESIAFNNVMAHYAECRGTSDSTTVNGIHYASITESVRSFTGRVSVCMQDFLADVALAGKRALEPFPLEYRLFRRIYLDGDEEFRSAVEKSMDQPNYEFIMNEIAKNVGRVFIDSGIYPLSAYAQTVSVR